MKYTEAQIKENIKAMYTKLNTGLTLKEFNKALKETLCKQDQEYKKDSMQALLCKYFSSGTLLKFLEYKVNEHIIIKKIHSLKTATLIKPEDTK